MTVSRSRGIAGVELVRGGRLLVGDALHELSHVTIGKCRPKRKHLVERSCRASRCRCDYPRYADHLATVPGSYSGACRSCCRWSSDLRPLRISARPKSATHRCWSASNQEVRRLDIPMDDAHSDGRVRRASAACIASSTTDRIHTSSSTSWRVVAAGAGVDNCDTKVFILGRCGLRNRVGRGGAHTPTTF